MKPSMMSCCVLPGAGITEADVAEMCRLMVEFGMEAVDFITLHGLPTERLKAVVDDFGLSVCAYTFLADFAHPTAAERTAGLDDVKRGIEDALTLGTSILMLPPAGNPAYTGAQNREYWIAGLQDSLPLAEAAGLTLTIEDFGMQPSTFVVSDDLLQAVEGVPGLKLTYDSGNVIIGGEDPVRGLERVLPYVVHVHFKDWYESPEPADGYTDFAGHYLAGAVFGRGMVDNARCLELLKGAGYEGFITVEASEAGYSGAAAVRLSTAWLNEAIARVSG